MDWSMRLVHCEACCALFFCSPSSSSQCLRRACHGCPPWGHQDPFKWAICPCSQAASWWWCYSGVTPHAQTAECLSSLPCVRCAPRPPTERLLYPTVPESSLHQLAASDSVCRLCLRWTLIYSHSFPQLLQRRHPSPHHLHSANQLLQSNKWKAPALSAYQKCPSSSETQLCVQLKPSLKFIP